MAIGKWLIIVVALALVYLLSPILTPFILGALLAYLGDPFVSFLAKHKVPRPLGVVFVFLIVITIVTVALLLLFPMMQQQFFTLVEKTPLLVDWVYAHTNLQEKMNVSDIKQMLSQNAGKVKDTVSIIIKALSRSTMTLVMVFTNLLLVPVVAFYFMRDWPRLMQKIVNFVPATHRERFVSLARSCDEVVGAFFKGQLCVMMGLGMVYSLGLWLVGLNIALLVGLMSGLLAIVPYLGATVGILTASIAMYLQTHEFLPVVYVWLVYAVGQSLEGMVLTPLLVGDRLGLHPVAVIFSVMAGGMLFGFFGVLVALPTAAVIWVLLRRCVLCEDEGKFGATRIGY